MLQTSTVGKKIKQIAKTNLSTLQSCSETSSIAWIQNVMTDGLPLYPAKGSHPS